MNLSTHFTLEEFTSSSIALRLNIKNVPNSIVMDNLKITAENLERVRSLLGKPIVISSGYRSPTLNRFIGGSTSSHHCLGFAIDFQCGTFGTPESVVRFIKNSNIKYDQLINEGNWVHISFYPSMRQQTLNAIFVKGKAVYSAFS